MTLLLAAAVGYLAGRLLWVLLRPTWSQPLFLRPNYRGKAVPTAAGAVLALTVVMVEGGRAVAGAAGLGAEAGPGQARLAVVVTAAGMALLGMVDDLSDPGQRRGFRGHVGALLRGELTAGGVKAVGGFAVALVAVAVTLGDPRPERLVADAALVALCANLGNLFDRAPGRAIKVGVASFLVLAVAAAGPSVLAPAAVVMGAAAALFVDDLHEHLMLGDAGANVLGAVVGLGVVLACAAATRTVVLLVVAALNLVSEVVSFTRVIAAVPPLRALDRAGRRHW